MRVVDATHKVFYGPLSCRRSATAASRPPRRAAPTPRGRVAGRAQASHYFSTTQVVMQRRFCTLVVLIGSTRVPPIAAVVSSSVRSSTT